MQRWSSVEVAERALDVLHDMADVEGYVGATASGMAPLIHVSVATAGRAMLRLVETESMTVVRRGHRGHPTVYRLKRAIDPEVLRAIPRVA